MAIRRCLVGVFVLSMAAAVLAQKSAEEQLKDLQAARDLVAKLEAAEKAKLEETSQPEIEVKAGSVKLVVKDGKHIAIDVGGEVTNIDQLDTNMKALDAKALVDSSSAMLLGYNLGVDSKDTRQLIKAKELDIVNAKIAAASSVQSNLSTSQKEIENALYGDLETLKVSLAAIKDTLSAPGPPHCKVGVEYQHKAGDAKNPPVCRYISTLPCPIGSFENSRPTRTSDRTCKDYKKCGEKEYISIQGTATGDTVCATLTACKSDESESVAPTATSDRSCQKKGGGGNCEKIGTGLSGSLYCVNKKSVGGDGSEKNKAGKSCFTIRHGHQVTKSGTFWCYFNEGAEKAFKVYCDMAACGRDASGEWNAPNVDKSGCGGWTLALKSKGTPDPCLNKKDGKWRSPDLIGSTEDVKKQCAKGPAYSKAPFTDVMMRSLSDWSLNMAWRHTVPGKSLHGVIGSCTRKHDGELIVPGYIQASHHQKLTATLYLDWYKKDQLNNHGGDKPRPSGLWHTACTSGQRFGFFVQDAGGYSNIAGCPHKSGNGGGVIGIANYNWHRQYTYEQYGATTNCISAYAFGGGYACGCESGTTSYQSHSTMHGHWWGHGGTGLWSNAHGIFVRDIRDVPGASLTKRHGEGVYTSKGGGHMCEGCRN